jgi:hypothetical protein
LGERSRSIGVLSKEDFDHAVAGERLRLDVLDISDLCRQIPLVKVDHAARHIVGQQAVVGPYYTDYWYIYAWENVGGCAKRSQCPKQRNHNPKYYESVWSPQCDSNDPHEHYLQVAFAAYVARTSFCR